MDPRLQQVRRALGEPAYESPSVLVYAGDSLDLLAHLPAASIALTVTSPPYNIGKEYESKRPLDSYLSWCEDWITLLYEATAPSGAFWLNLGYVPVPGRARAMPLPYLLWDRVPFFLVQEVVWNYGAGVAARRGFSPRNEKFLWYVRQPAHYYFDLDSVRDPNVKYPNQFKNGKRKVNPLGKNPTDVWQFPKVTSGKDRSSPERTPHPAQFPLAVVERIIRACSRPGDLVLDPFLGSGTVCEAAMRLQRPVVGFEIDSSYVDLTARRLEAAAQNIAADEAQLRLGAGVEG